MSLSDEAQQLQDMQVCDCECMLVSVIDMIGHDTVRYMCVSLVCVMG